MALQWMFLLLLTPLLAAQNRGKCKIPSDWDPKLRFTPERTDFALNEVVQLSCEGKIPGKFAPSVPQIQCISRGGQILWNETPTCKAKCRKPQWDARLQFLENKPEYPQNREVTLTCPEGLEPSFSEVKCTKEIQRVTPGKPVYVDAWWGRSSTGAWTRIEGNVLCMGGCRRPQWDSSLQLAPDQENYKKDEKVMLSCPEGFQPPFTEIQCQTQFQYDDHYGTPVYEEFWLGRDSSGAWVPILSSVECIEICQRPQWDSSLQLAPDQMNYKKNEKVMLSCPEGFQPPFTEIQCQTQFNDDDYGTPVYEEFWLGRDSSGAWVPILSSVECIEVLQVDPNTFEISSTSIQLKWTCRFPDACQGMRARCRLAMPSSPPCEAEKVNGEQMLHGQEGTFTCSPLQPFTEYNVTIDLPPNTTLFSRIFTTRETGQTVGQWHWIVIGLVVLLADRLVVAVILWLVHSRKRKYLPS